MNDYHRTYIKIRTPRALVNIFKGNSETRFIIQLNYGAQSVKRIQYDQQRKKFMVYNEIDDTRQALTSKQLISPRHTIIGSAMRSGALYAELHQSI